MRKSSYKINFQLFAEPLREEDVELLNYVGLDAEGNPLVENNEEENQNGPLDINEESGVTPEIPDKLPDSEPGADAPAELLEGTEKETVNEKGNEPALTEQTPLILGKFKSQAELERAYQELQNLLGRKSNEISELRGRLQSAPEEASSDNDGLFDGISNEQILEGLAADPKKFLTELLSIAGEGTLVKAKSALKAEAERERYLKDFFDGNSDFADLREDFIVISDRVQDPEIALNAVRGMKIGNLENLFSDAVYLKRHLDSPGMKELFADVAIAEKLSDKLKQKIIDDYLKKAKASQSQVNLMTNELGSAPKTPPKKYNSINDVTEDAVSFLKELEKNK